MKLAIITDIHEDIISLTHVLRMIDKQQVDDIICLGDISGFSVPYYSNFDTRNAHECLKLIKTVCKFIVLGNHDLFAARIIPMDCYNFKFPANWYELDYRERKELAKNLFWLHEENDLLTLYSDEDISFLKTLPQEVVFDTGDYSILFSHYIFPNICGMHKSFFTYADEFTQHFSYMQDKQCKISFCGHAHSPGFFIAKPGKINRYRYSRKKLPEGLSCISLPPVTSNNMKSGFCIFDSETMSVNVIKL